MDVSEDKMKNLFVLLCCFTLISALPTYATKVIINNNNDRIVYSRSSGPENKINEEENLSTETVYYGNKNSEQNETKLLLLGNDFRLELAGTKWNLNDNTQSVKYAPPSEYTVYKEKRDSREAADYYYVDETKNPNTLIPSWTTQ